MSFTECRICLEVISGASIISVQAKVTDEENVLGAIEEVTSLQGSPDDLFPQYVCKKCFKLLNSTVTFRRLIIASYAEFKKKLTINQLDKNKKDEFVNSESVKFISIESLSEINTELKIETDSTQILEAPLFEDSTNEELKAESEEDTIKNNDDLNVVEINETDEDLLHKGSVTKQIYKVRKKDKIVTQNTSRICSLCGKIIKGKQNYNAHMNMHKNHIPPLVYACPVCPKQFSQKKYLLVHRRSHTGEKPFHCDICNKNFSQFASYYVHKRRLHDKVVQGTCSYCGKKFVDKPELDVHIKMWHTDKLKEANIKDDMFHCSRCGRCFTLQCYLTLHERKCLKIIQCERCNKIFQKTFNLNRHRKTCIEKQSLNLNYCTLCNFQSSSKSVLIEHYNTYHSIEIINKQYHLNTWDEFVTWKNKLQIETKTRFVKTGAYYKNNFKTYRFVCHRDGYFKPHGKGIRNVQLLNSYKINGHCPAKIIADVDKNGSVNVVYCDTHIGHNFEIGRFYMGERPYLCEFCSATFVCNRTLQRHRREIHSEKKPCHICGKMLGDYALKKHLVRHQVLEEGLTITRKKYTCEYCKTVMNFTSRRRHLEKQHGIKLYGRGDDCKKICIKEALESA